MKKKEQLKPCNWALALLAVLMLASSIQLEATNSQSAIWVWVHLILGIVMTIAVVWHLWLHYRGRWSKLFTRQTKPKVKFMVLFIALTAISGIIATFQWLPEYAHTGIGGLHGKLGFVFLFLAITHGLHYKRFYLEKCNQQ